MSHNKCEELHILSRRSFVKRSQKAAESAKETDCPTSPFLEAGIRKMHMFMSGEFCRVNEERRIILMLSEVFVKYMFPESNLTEHLHSEFSGILFATGRFIAEEFLRDFFFVS